MATYVNNLRLKEIATGAESGTWGTSTNTNLELIADALGSGTEAITTNADTHTTTIADGAADEGRALFLKYTGTLDSACTITLAPNTVNKMWFIENATSGSQNIIISQGSGANITIASGKIAVVYTDGAGSGAAVLDALADLELSSTLSVAGATTLTGVTTHGGNVVSDTDSTDDLGTTGVRWANLWVDAITMGGAFAGATATLSSTLAVTGDTSILNGSGLVVGHTALLRTGGQTSEFQVSGTAAGDSTVAIASWADNSSSGALSFYHARGGTIGTNSTAVASGDQLGEIRVYGGDGTDADTLSSAIIFDTEGTIGTGQVPGVIKFKVAAAGTLATAMTIDSTKAVTIAGDLTVSGTGPHAIGGTVSTFIGLKVHGAFTSSGSSTVVTGIRVAQDLTAVNGDTTRHTLFEIGNGPGGTITTQSNSETVSVISTMYIDEPDITKGTDTVTLASTVYIKQAPDEGTTNAALYVASGASMFADGSAAAPGIGFSAQPATGLYRPSSNVIGFAIAGAERAQLSGSGDLQIDGDLTVDGTTQTSSGTTGSIHTDGGLGVAKDLFVSGNISLAATSGVYFDGGAHTLIKENSANVLRCVAGGSGGVDLTNGATSWTAVSDERAKNLGEPIIDAMAKLGTLRTIFGTYRDDHQKIRHPFLIAQDVLAVYPEAVVMPEEEDLYRLSYTDMIPLMISGMNETGGRIETIEQTVERLTARIDELEATA